MDPWQRLVATVATLLWCLPACDGSDESHGGSGAATASTTTSTGAGGTSGAGGSTGACTQPPPSPLQLGWVTASPLHVAKQEPYWLALEDAGANFLVAYSASHAENPDFSWIVDFLVRAEARDIEVAVQIPTDILEAGDQAALRSLAETVGQSPALYGWYVDEPGCCGSQVTPELLADAYGTIHGVTDHPFVVVLAAQKSTCNYDPDYLASIDVVMSENYPIKDGTPEFEGALSQTAIAEACSVNDDAIGRPGYVAILQGFGLDADGQPQFNSRDPTYRELRYMLFTTLVRDVRGAVYWVDYRANDALKTSVNTVLHEATSSMGVLAEGTFGDPTVAVDAPDIAYRYAATACGTYLLAINEAGGVPGQSLTDVTFTLPSSVQGSEMEVLFDGFDEISRSYQSRTVPLDRQGSEAPRFSDDFEPYGVRLYALR